MKSMTVIGTTGMMLVILMGAVAAAQNPAAPLTWKNYAETRDRVLPTAKEKGWQEIPWRSDLLSAAAEATKKDMPLLIWAMNGDPLGCT